MRPRPEATSAVEAGARHDPLLHAQRRARRPAGAERPLRRSREVRWIAGVCGGIAAFVGARPTVVRIVWLVSLVPSLGITLLAYPALWLLLPAEPVKGASTDAAAGAPRSPSDEEPSRRDEQGSDRAERVHDAGIDVVAR